MKAINLILTIALSTQVYASSVLDWCSDIDTVIYNKYQSSDLLPLGSGKRYITYVSKNNALPQIINQVCGATPNLTLLDSSGASVTINVSGAYNGYNRYVHMLLEDNNKKMLTKLALFVSRPNSKDIYNYSKLYDQSRYTQVSLFNHLEKNEEYFLEISDILINQYCFNNRSKDPRFGGSSRVWNEFLVSLSSTNFLKVEKILNNFSQAKALYKNCNNIVNF